jgi:NAD(P)-dependent dehydrogenase (short-subunit alcohol dehydrogenase family)
MSTVWIVTGAEADRHGRAIAEASLEAGDQVGATARHTDQLPIWSRGTGRECRSKRSGDSTSLQ